MALIDTLGAAQRGATAGMQDYAVRLASAQAANQVASDAVQRELDRQRILRPTGVTPRTTSADVFASQATPEFKPIGGEVTPATVQQKRTNYTGFKPPIYSAAPVPAGLTPPGVTPTTPATPATPAFSVTAKESNRIIAALDPIYRDRFDALPKAKKQEIRNAINATGGTYAEVKAVLEKYIPTTPRGGIYKYPDVEVFKASPNASRLEQAATGIGNAGYNLIGNVKGFVEDVTVNPLADFWDWATMPQWTAPAVPAAAETAAETAATGTETAAAAPIPTASQRSGYENTVFSTVGLTPPPAAEQPVNEPQPAKAGLTEDTVDPNLPPEYASRNARMRMTPDGMEWRGQQFMAERESITQAVNQVIQDKQYAYQVGVESRNRQYENLVAQARDAATAGNTTYAQTLMTQAETILQQADDADVQIRNDVAMIRAKANSAYSNNDMDLWLHQATIAEQEFMRGNNPSRMLSIMEAMGNPTEIEDAGGGLYRIRHPAEGGGYVYERDSSGKVLEVPNTGVSDYMMRIISEERKAQDIANQAAAAALQSEREFELLKLSAESNMRIVEKVAEANVKPEDYDWETQADGSYVGRPKSGKGSLLIVTQIPEGDGKPARFTVVEAPLP